MRGAPAAPQALTQREAPTSAGAAPGGTHSGSLARKPLTSQLGVPGWILVGFVVAGGAVRAVACLALWPAATTLSDAATYAVDAASNPMADPQHPAGYPALLALIGVFTRSVAVPILLQHALGIAAAVLLFAAVRRLVGSPWPALLPAAVVLLNTDEIFLEHNVMSEALFLFLLAVAIYASVRAIDAPARSAWRWAAVAGAVCVGSTIVRSAGLFGIPVLAVAMALSRPPAVRHRWRASATFLVVATVGLAGYGFANLAVNGRFELAPAAGWHLYARVGRFADCRRFTPPPGTAGLCESTPPSKRGWGPDFYLYAAQSPARRRFGRVGSHDGEVGSFAIQAILHQPAAMADAVLMDVSRYFVPSARPHGWYTGWDIDPQLEWSREGGPGYARDALAGMLKFFSRFVPRRNGSLIGFMSVYERVVGFGATLLTACTLLTLLGLLIGPRRNRIGVLLFGVGGLAQLLGPTASVLYMGRYTVPLAGPIAGGAAIALWSLSRTLRPWRHRLS